MRRRPTASGKSAKPRSPTTKAKRRNKPNASAARAENEVARLTRELDDALERQAATSEVLSMVSSPSGELDLIFRAILEKATRNLRSQLRASLSRRRWRGPDGRYAWSTAGPRGVHATRTEARA